MNNNKKTPVNPFDDLAQSAPATSSKKASEKVSAEVTDEIKNAVDIFITNKSELKRIESVMSDTETKIISHVRPQQDKLARSGEFTKSMRVDGNNGSVLFSTSDRFSLPKDPEAQKALKELVGDKFDLWFETKRTISLKESAQSDSNFIQKLVKALSSVGIKLGDAFDVFDKLIAKADLDKKQYDLNESKLEEFRSLVRQNKPALK